MGYLITYINWEELRNWFALVIGIIGGIIAIRQFRISQEQRKLENSFRMINLFRESLSDDDIKNWTWLFHAASHEHGAIHGHYLDDGNQVSLDCLFSEGPPDNGAIERMAELFDLIGYSALKGDIDIRVIYFELGQLMYTIYNWLIEISYCDSKVTFIQHLYPSYYKMFNKYKRSFERWNYKTYEHIG